MPNLMSIKLLIFFSFFWYLAACNFFAWTVLDLYGRSVCNSSHKRRARRPPPRLRPVGTRCSSGVIHRLSVHYWREPFRPTDPKGLWSGDSQGRVPHNRAIVRAVELCLIPFGLWRSASSKQLAAIAGCIKTMWHFEKGGKSIPHITLPPEYWTQSWKLSSYSFESSILSQIIVLRQPGVSKSTYLMLKNVIIACHISSCIIYHTLKRATMWRWAVKAPVPHITLLKKNQFPELPRLYKQRNMIKIGKCAAKSWKKSLWRPLCCYSKDGISLLLWFLH